MKNVVFEIHLESGWRALVKKMMLPLIRKVIWYWQRMDLGLIWVGLEVNYDESEQQKAFLCKMIPLMEFIKLSLFSCGLYNCSILKIP